MSGQTDTRTHEVIISQRNELRVQGVRDIDSFDENGAILQTDMGELTVEGGELKIGILDTDRGVVTISGRINGLFYSKDDVKEKRGLLSRIFK